VLPQRESTPLVFATTRWTLVLESHGESPAAREALEKLCRIYWRPVYAFALREGVGAEEAKDVTQGFFALILERKDFQSVRREKGRLRSFLLASLKHFMANARRDAAAIKRGGGQIGIPLDNLEAEDHMAFEAPGAPSADLIYDRRWALTLLDQVFARLRDDFREAANAPLLGKLTLFLSEDPDRPSQAEIAREFAMTENAVKQALHRLRQRYRQLLREEIAQTVATPAEIEDELRYLVAVLRS
jgi:RNA polymerase sigma-70 factor (ECF subfamily)